MNTALAATNESRDADDHDDIPDVRDLLMDDDEEDGDDPPLAVPVG